eukprot:TRINITY_DN7899_c0_g1_i1.p1 TRINITY_DN7899_c0_g1~~TRINITY_DN7899_c0_g1_i1.p1  ORF type:complete len:159 (+),score=3.51 TRINITY_DN7899_c0_g1_i1:276-752(+)
MFPKCENCGLRQRKQQKCKISIVLAITNCALPKIGSENYKISESIFSAQLIQNFPTNITNNLNICYHIFSTQICPLNFTKRSNQFFNLTTSNMFTGQNLFGQITNQDAIAKFENLTVMVPLAAVMLITACIQHILYILFYDMYKMYMYTQAQLRKKLG